MSLHIEPATSAVCCLAVPLCRTGDAKYKTEGLSWYMKHYAQEEGSGVWNNFDWDSNSWGAALLLTR